MSDRERPDTYQAVQAHLSIMQGVIQRMASNSASSQGWCITLVAALLVVVTDKGKPQLAWRVLVPTLLFLALDAYYLGLEKAFRRSYNSCIEKLHAGRLSFSSRCGDGGVTFMYKSSKHVCLVVFFLVMLSMALPATAQDAARVELSGGYNFLRLFDEDLGDEKNFPGGWYGEVAGNLTDMFAIVGQVAGNYKTLTFDNTDFDFNLHVFSAGVRVSSRASQRVVPFAHILGGGVRSSLKGGGEEESWADGFLLIGGGVNVMPNARVGIRLGADYVRAFTEDEGLNVFRFAAGIVLPFGSR